MPAGFASTPVSEPLRLLALDADDLAVIAAVLQDAVVKREDLTYLAKQHRFAAVLNRFRWEREASARGHTKTDAKADRGPGAKIVHQRVRTGLHFDGVLGVRTRNFDDVAPDAVLALLTVHCATGPKGTAAITLVFADDRDIRLDVECVDAHLADLTLPWQAKGKPDHPL